MLNYISTCKIFKLIPILQVLIIKVSSVQFIEAAGSGTCTREEKSCPSVVYIAFHSVYIAKELVYSTNQPYLMFKLMFIYSLFTSSFSCIYSVAAATVQFVYFPCSSIAVYLQINKFTNSYPNNSAGLRCLSNCNCWSSAS